MKNLISFTTGTLLTGIAYFLGGWDTAIQTLILVMGIDYITGVIKANFPVRIAYQEKNQCRNPD